MTNALHIFAREIAALMPSIRNKLVSYNQIIETAMLFYNDPKDGIIECLQSCCPNSDMYDGKNTLAIALPRDYKWMIAND
jgi:hypothetical protein